MTAPQTQPSGIADPVAGAYRIQCYDRDGNLKGWLDSYNNWLWLNPNQPDASFYDYSYGGELFICNGSRYVGDNGNEGKGDTAAAWNLWARATGIAWKSIDGGPTAFIHIAKTPGQILTWDSNTYVYWATNEQIGLCCKKVPA